jgi:DNA-binding NarL/FixJ family response regulator
MNLLIVEHDAATCLALRSSLSAAVPGSRVLEASTGARALEICARERPELVVVGARLPDTDGLALTSRLRALSPAPVVIVVARVDGGDVAERARAAGVYAYVAKDRLATDLVPAVSRALGTERL